jgi:hypothetical protein
MLLNNVICQQVLINKTILINVINVINVIKLIIGGQN